MHLEKKLKDYKTSMKIVPKEQNIKETVRKSIEVYCSVEEDRLLTYHEFLWAQLRLIRKRWWLFQLVLLLVLWTAHAKTYGGGSLFVYHFNYTRILEKSNLSVNGDRSRVLLLFATDLFRADVVIRHRGYCSD